MPASYRPCWSRVSSKELVGGLWFGTGETVSKRHFTLILPRRQAVLWRPCMEGRQAASPGFSLKCCSNLSFTPFHLSASSGGGFLKGMFGQREAYLRFWSSHLGSAAGSVSGKIA